jgi:glycerophosphoryl diester phosphodiesterase
VFLDDANTPSELPTLAELRALAAQGVNVVGPPMWALLTVDGNGRIASSEYARNAKAAKLDIITWTLERSGRIVEEVLPTRALRARRSTTRRPWTPCTSMATS